MIRLFGGGGGLPPGITGDGLTPGGLNVAGRVKAGSRTETVESFHALAGTTTIEDSDAAQANGDDVLDLYQRRPLTEDQSTSALNITRYSPLNGHVQDGPVVNIAQTVNASGPLLRTVGFNDGRFAIGPDATIRTTTAVAHTLGAYSGNAVPIYDESGVLQGWLPLYA